VTGTGGGGHAGGDYGEDEYDDELTTSVASTSLPSTLHRRSSAPEMDEKLIESTSASISVVSSDVSSMKTNYPAPALVKPPLPEKPRGHAGGGLGSKSLDRASAAKKHHRHPPYSSFSADRISDASAPSSDSEAAPAITPRHFDRQGAKVKAVIHRSPASPASSQAMMASLGPYDTIKPSRMRSKGGSSNDSSNSYVPKSNSSSSSAKTVIKVAAAETAASAVQPSQQQQLLPKVTLKRADSFEGHEEAVRTLVEAVNESRKFEATSAAAKQLRKDDNECE